MIKYKLLADFKTPGAEKLWKVVNDEVTGGGSESRLAVTPDGTALFEGTLSLENSGGFASVSIHIGDLLLDGFRGIAIRVKGDGKLYRISIGTGDKPDGPAYQMSFATEPDAWTTPYFPFSEFLPFFRGDLISGAAPMNPAEIRRIGLMTADRQPGAFRLEIEWIKAYLDY